MRIYLFCLSLVVASNLSACQLRRSSVDVAREGDCEMAKPVWMGKRFEDKIRTTLLMSSASLGSDDVLLKKHLSDSRVTDLIGAISCINDDPSYVEVTINFPNASDPWYRYLIPIARSSLDYESSELVRVMKGD